MINDRLSHTLILSRYSEESESYKYNHINTVISRKEANRLARNFSGEYGDILIVCDTAYVFEPHKYSKDVYAVDEVGSVLAASQSPNEGLLRYSWTKFWEEADGLAVMESAIRARVDHAMIVRAACLCVKALIKHLSDGEYSSHHAIDMALEWAEGRRDKEVALMSSRTILSKSEVLDRAIRAAVNSVVNPVNADGAVKDSASGFGSYREGMEVMTTIVKSSIPLHVAIIAAARK